MSAAHAMPQAAETKATTPAAKPFRLSMLIPGLMVNLAAPIAILKGLELAGVAPVWALAGGCVPPLLANLWTWARSRRIDAAGFLIVASMATGVIGSLVTGDLGARIVTDCLVGCGWAFGFGGSLLLGRPALFYLIRSLVAGDDVARAETWNGLWRFPTFRGAMRAMTAIWATVYVIQVLIEFGLSRLISANTLLTFTPLMSTFGTLGLIAFTRLRMRSLRRRLERQDGLSWPL